VLVGAATYRRLPDGAAVEPMPTRRVNGKETLVDAYVVRAIP